MKAGSKSWRARRALIRLSRDRWISPDECSRILVKWVGNRNAYYAAIKGYDIVGIIGGRPPAYPFDSYFKDVYKVVKNGKNETEIMIKLLSILEKKL